MLREAGPSFFYLGCGDTSRFGSKIGSKKAREEWLMTSLTVLPASILIGQPTPLPKPVLYPAHPELSYQKSGVYSKHCRLSFSPRITKIGQIRNFEKEPLAIHHPPCHSQRAGRMYPETELIKMVGKVSSPCGPALSVNHERWQGNHSGVTIQGTNG